MFKILVACEESQAVLSEIINLGINDIDVHSCDILPTSGNYPQLHWQTDVIQVMRENIFDMVIAFPPCTHLACSGASYFEVKRKDGRQLEGLQFFDYIYSYNCKYKMIENPVNIIGGDYVKKYYPQFSYIPKPTQYIQPYEYGEKARKKTGLWLHNLPLLRPTNIVEPILTEYVLKNGRKTTMTKGFSTPNAYLRSKTYPGIAKAIATQLVTYAYYDNIERN